MASIIAGCATTGNPAKRIERHRPVFDSLPPDHQQLVAGGQIREGMSKDAVYLAWGRPNGTARGSRKGVPFETWTYTEMKPTFRGHGLGWHYAGYYDYYDPMGIDLMMATSYYDLPVARVQFLNNKVISWRNLR